MIDESAESLSKFGITLNQAKIYLAALGLGETTIEPISKLSNIRREDVYRALPRLYQLGLVHRILGTPLRVRAIPMKEATTILLQEKMVDMEAEMTSLATLSSQLIRSAEASNQYTIDNEGNPQFETVEGKVAVRRKSLELARSSQNSVSLVVTDRHLTYLIENWKTEPRSANNGRSVRVIAPPPSRSKMPAIKDWQDSVEDHVDVIFKDNIDMFFGIYDQRLVYLYVPCDGDQKCSLISSTSQLISLFNYYFDSLWNDHAPSNK